MDSKQIDLHLHIYHDKVAKANTYQVLLNELLSEQEQKRVREAVTNLPEPYRSIIQEYYFTDKQTRVIMQELGISPVRFYNCLHKGKFLLRSQLNPAYYTRAKEILYGKG